jgi:hypothetical protein
VPLTSGQITGGWLSVPYSGYMGMSQSRAAHAGDQIAAWVADLRTIQAAAYNMFHDRRMFEEYEQLIVAANVPHSSLFDDQYRWYAGSQLSAARRLVDDDPRAISLTNLLSDIAEHQAGQSPRTAGISPPITRAWFLRTWMQDSSATPLFAEQEKRRAHAAFDSFAGSKDVLPAGVVAADRKKLTQSCKVLGKFTSQHIAHHDRQPTAPAPKLQDLNQFIDVFGELIRKYVLVLTCDSVADLVPALQSDWKAPFRQAWI